jgi:hypothetical protein
MANRSRRSKHQITDSELERLAQMGDSPSQGPDVDDESPVYTGSLDFDHPLRCTVLT